MLHWLREHAPGLGLILFVGLGSHLGADYLPGVNGIMLGLLLGIALGNIISLPKNFEKGVGFSSSKVLEFSIVMMAFSINFGHFAKLGYGNLLLVVLVMLGVLLLTVFLARKLNCPDSTGFLVGFGTAICGSSAIAAVAPSITKNNADIGIAFAVVNLMGSLGMIAMPFVLSLFQLTEIENGVVVGASLHSVGNVAGAGYGMDKLVGDTAISIKMARVALLSPAVIFFTFLVNRKNAGNWKDHFKLPLYLWAFIAVTLMTTFLPIPENFIQTMSSVAKLLLTFAMVAIGFKVSFKNLYQSGRKAMTFGLVIFGVQIILIAIFMVVL
ncbi:MAG: putative sulfate exporter family transporter [Cryomorphaceae bacterium]|nr:putative sulfate exporter family transporter [Cryomorphaceae bacterium]